MSRRMCYAIGMSKAAASRRANASGKSNPRFALDLLFRALADSTRLRLLNLMADREICVCYFIEILCLSQPKISRHLAYLRRAGIVSARRQGKWMYYRLLRPESKVASGILSETIHHLRRDAVMQRDLEKLNLACCAPQKFVLLQGAPQPLRIASQSR